MFHFPSLGPPLFLSCLLKLEGVRLSKNLVLFKHAPSYHRIKRIIHNKIRIFVCVSDVKKTPSIVVIANLLDVTILSPIHIFACGGLFSF